MFLARLVRTNVKINQRWHGVRCSCNVSQFTSTACEDFFSVTCVKWTREQADCEKNKVKKTSPPPHPDLTVHFTASAALEREVRQPFTLITDIVFRREGQDLRSPYRADMSKWKWDFFFFFKKEEKKRMIGGVSVLSRKSELSVCWWEKDGLRTIRRCLLETDENNQCQSVFSWEVPSFIYFKIFIFKPGLWWSKHHTIDRLK